MAAVLAWLRWLAESAIIAAVWGYRLAIRPFLPPACRFEPSCSEYMIQAVRKHGPVCGAARGVWRVCRCNPFCQGGYDPP